MWTPEAVHSLYWGTVDPEVVVAPLLLLAEIHHQLLCLADIQKEVVVLAPVLQVHLLQVDLLIILRDQANHSVISKNMTRLVELEVAIQSSVQ